MTPSEWQCKLLTSSDALDNRKGNMYHLFVTAQEGAWNTPFYEYDRSRFLEYTNDTTAKAFEFLTEKHIAILLTWPCLFAYEGTEEDVRVGRLLSIKERGRSILIEIDVNPDIPPIPFTLIQPIALALDIRAWEMSRTHWAIKDEDLFQRLRNAGLIQYDPVQMPAVKLPDTATPTLAVSTVGGFIECRISQLGTA